MHDDEPFIGVDLASGPDHTATVTVKGSEVVAVSRPAFSSIALGLAASLPYLPFGLSTHRRHLKASPRSPSESELRMRLAFEKRLRKQASLKKIQYNLDKQSALKNDISSQDPEGA